MNVTSRYREYDSVAEMLASIKKDFGDQDLAETIQLRREAGLCDECSEQATDCKLHN